MYFTYGWPRTFAALPETVSSSDDSEASSCPDPPRIVSLHLDSEYCIVLGQQTIQIWTGGKNRVKLGQLSRDAASLHDCGVSVTGVWSSSRHQLAVLTSRGFLLLYGIRLTKDVVLQAQGAAARSLPTELRAVNIYLQYCIPIENTDHVCPEVVADSRTIIVGAADGVLHAFTWLGKLRSQGSPLPITLALSKSSLFPMSSAPLTAGLKASNKLSSAPSSQPSGSPWQRAETSPAPLANGTSPSDELTGGSMDLQSMDYAPAIKQVVMALADGRVGLCRVPDDGLLPLELWSFSHWLCGSRSGACIVRMCAAGQLAAVGMNDGSVQLYSLLRSQGQGLGSGPSQGAPLRVLSLLDWGYGESLTGAVSAMRWSPDGRALAVGFAEAGLVAWSPSGCRLLCSLRQGSGTAKQRSRGDTLPSATSPMFSGLPGPPLPLEGGVHALAWGPFGYHLLVAETCSTAQVVDLSFAKALHNSHRVLHGGQATDVKTYGQEEAVHVLQADDRLLLITEAQGVSPTGMDQSSSGLTVNHLLVPLHYLGTNYPIMQAAISADGMDVAVAGRHGLALYSRRSSRWRVFGDISQEREIRVQVIVWLPKVVVVCAQLDALSGAGDGAAAQLLLYPRYHLDNSSILAKYPLMQAPIAVDAVGNYLLLACAPLDLTLLHVTLEGPLTPSAQPRATLTVVRELSIMSVGQALRDIALVAPQRVQDMEPKLCVLQRAGGCFSILDMNEGSEVVLSKDVECFWLPAAPVWKYSQRSTASFANTKSALRVTRTMHVREETVLAATQGREGITDTQLQASTSGYSHVQSPQQPRPASEQDAGEGNVEMPWWTYGPRGMQLWFPSAMGAGATHGKALPTPWACPQSTQDPELEFDKEVYPIGISFAEVAIIGVTQRTVRSLVATDSERLQGSLVQYSPQEHYPCFHPLPESQPVLPCLLRRLLQQGKFDEALTLARNHSRAPHFPRSLEWLLFTTLEIDAERFLQQMTKQKSRGQRLSLHADKVPLVTAAARLLKHFPKHFPDITVRVARKTDSVLWPVLFEAVGPPRDVLEVLLGTGSLQSAACCLIIVDSIEGSSVAHQAALKLIRATLADALYPLTAELVRYLLPPGDADAILMSIHQDGITAVEQAVQAQLTTHSVPAQLPTKDQNATWLSWLLPSTADAAPGAPPGPRQGSQNAVMVNGSTNQSLGNANHATGSEPNKIRSVGAGPLSPRSVRSTEVVAKAWSVIGRHAWALLEQGCLRALVNLGSAFSHLGLGLTSLLATTADITAKTTSAMGIVSALAVVDAEFTKLDDVDVVNEACYLLDVLKSVSSMVRAPAASMWVAAIAVALQDMSTLAGVRDADRELWNQFATVVIRDSAFDQYAQTVRLIHLDGMVEGRLNLSIAKQESGGAGLPTAFVQAPNLRHLAVAANSMPSEQGAKEARAAQEGTPADVVLGPSGRTQTLSAEPQRAVLSCNTSLASKEQLG